MKELKQEVDQICEEQHQLREDEAFAMWFLRSFVCDDDDEALDALTGGKNDKNIDAIVIDRKLRSVIIVQSKYRLKQAGKNEKRNDVLEFAYVAEALNDQVMFKTFTSGLPEKLRVKLKEAKRLLADSEATLQLYYVTTAKCSESLMREAEDKVRQQRRTWAFEVVDHKRVLRLLEDYLDGVAPPIPLLELEIESGNGVSLKGVLQRHDSRTSIESWVVPVSAHTVARMYENSGVRLFARNVRGFLGSTTINQHMRDTLQLEPEYFWYYNNGITIICDDAEKLSKGGKDVLRLRNPQVINGQQTTRTLESHSNPKATVLLRVIGVPRHKGHDKKGFDRLVSKIVAATNFQNAIKQSDLMSNDSRQIEIERAFRRLGYFYLRKRMTKGEAKAQAPAGTSEIIGKETLAQAIAACDLDPALVRGGTEQLFSEKYYQSIFPNGNPYYYLVRFWTLMITSSAARGSAYGKYIRWIATRFVWDEIQPMLKGQTSVAAFEKCAKRTRIPSLEKCAVVVLRSLSGFCRKTIKESDGSVDLQNLVKRRGVHDDFRKFWRSKENKHHREAFTYRWARLEKEWTHLLS